MSQTQEYRKKIEQLRKRLVGDLDLPQLKQMQLQIDLLERAAEAGGNHDHDTSQHQDTKLLAGLRENRS